MLIENKSKVLNICIIPAMLYGCEIWALTKEVLKKMRATVRKLERIMLGVYLKDRKKNTWIRQKTGATDIGEKIWTLKWNWAGHLGRRNDGRWSQDLLSWYPMGKNRRIGRPKGKMG
jgi:hypothetical protein